MLMYSVQFALVYLFALQDYIDVDMHSRCDSMKREIAVLDKCFSAILKVARNIAARSKG